MHAGLDIYVCLHAAIFERAIFLGLIDVEREIYFGHTGRLERAVFVSIYAAKASQIYFRLRHIRVVVLFRLCLVFPFKYVRKNHA